MEARLTVMERRIRALALTVVVLLAGIAVGPRLIAEFRPKRRSYAPVWLKLQDVGRVQFVDGPHLMLKNQETDSPEPLADRAVTNTEPLIKAEVFGELANNTRKTINWVQLEFAFTKPEKLLSRRIVEVLVKIPPGATAHIEASTRDLPGEVRDADEKVIRVIGARL